MSENQRNIFQEATQLVSLDCSSIAVQNTTMCQQLTQSLHQSLLNLKIILPSFATEFSLFRQQIIDMVYYIVNKIMTTIKIKNDQITKLQIDLQKSQSLTNTMKKEVIQLKEMIAEFMQSFSKQSTNKDRIIQQKQKQIQQLKSLINSNQYHFLSQTFKPLTVCQQTTKINQFFADNQSISKMKDNQGCFNNTDSKHPILIEMSESIVFADKQCEKRTSLEIIHEEGSDINSLTDYLHSQRPSQNPDKDFTSKEASEFNKSPFQSNIKENQVFYTGVKSQKSQKTLKSQKLETNNQNYYKQQSPLRRLSFNQNFEQKYQKDNFISGRINKPSHDQEQYFRIQNQRKKSQNNLINQVFDGYKIQRKSIQRIPLSNKSVQNLFNQISNKQSMNIKSQIQQISKSSSSSDILHFGDTDKINAYLPKKLDSPKNMGFVKKNSSRKQNCQSTRLKTQPTPRQEKLNIDKQNINIGLYVKPIQIGKKIFARKKTIITHAKASNTSRVESKVDVKDISNLPVCLQYQIPNTIEIKLIQSPQKTSQRLKTKSSHLLKPSIQTIFSVTHQQNNRYSNHHMPYSSVNANISNINQSNVKSHLSYHSVGKSNLLGENTSNKSTIFMQKSTSVMTPKSKPYDRKSHSKSKQKIKVVSKHSCSLMSSKGSQNGSGSKNSKSDHKQNRKVIDQMMNHNYFASSNGFNKSFNKSKNVAVHLGANSFNNLYIRHNLKDIKQGFQCYNIESYLEKLRQVYCEGQIINGLKQGYLRIIYDNGLIYEGFCKQGKLQGSAKLILNGIQVFEGQFYNGKISGQGYLKFLRFLCPVSQCPKILQDASYFGRFVQNKFDGMGTIFLNQKQKIVTKFTNGQPYGQLTFYTENDIEFGHWP